MFKFTIESVVADIQKKITKLRNLAAEHHNAHLIHTEESVRHTDLANQEIFNREKAIRIADKLDELLK